MLDMKDIVAATKRGMTEQQARAIYGFLYGREAAESAGTSELLKVNRCDKFDAHRILSYVLNHTMSDEDNARYIKDQLGLEG